MIRVNARAPTAPEAARDRPEALAPKATVVIEPRRRLLELDVRGLWQYRELFYFLTWRDVKVRYKQTAMGAAWALLQPLVTMGIFTAIFGHFARIPSDGVPYPVFAYTALVPWTFFATALNRCALSVVSDTPLISKIYFPRLITPLAATIAGLLDFAVAFAILLGMVVWFGITPSWGLLALPLLVLLTLLTALAVGIWLSALNVLYRDVSHAVPVLIQFWMYASPVAYPVSIVPDRWRFLYGLNPMTGVIEGFRWAVLGKASPDLVAIALSTSIALILFLTGVAYFNRMERIFADLI